jgi:hypothetical protein
LGKSSARKGENPWPAHPHRPGGISSWSLSLRRTPRALLNLSRSETVEEILHVLGDVVVEVESLGEIVIGVSGDHGEDLSENFDALARRNGDRSTEPKQMVMSGLAVVDQHEGGVAADVAIDACGHGDIVGARDELGLVTDRDRPEELALALEVEPMHVVRGAPDQACRQLAGAEVRQATEGLDLEGPVSDELSGDLHVRPRSVTEIGSREETGLRCHGLVVGTDVDGRRCNTAAKRVVKGLMETLNNTYDCGHFLSLPVLIRPHGLAGGRPAFYALPLSERVNLRCWFQGLGAGGRRTAFRGAQP